MQNFYRQSQHVLKKYKNDFYKEKFNGKIVAINLIKWTKNAFCILNVTEWIYFILKMYEEQKKIVLNVGSVRF